MSKTTARALYAAEPQDVIAGERVIGEFLGTYFNHMPELGECVSTKGMKPNERVTVRVVHRTDFDPRRYWQLATVWLDNIPFMVIQNAGREGDDHSARFITRTLVYQEAARYLRSLIAMFDGAVEKDEIDADEERTDLDEFYGDTPRTTGATLARYGVDRSW